MPPIFLKLNAGPNQRSVDHMFAKKSNEADEESTGEVHESKQDVLIDLSMHQVENEIGNK